MMVKGIAQQYEWFHPIAVRIHRGGDIGDFDSLTFKMIICLCATEV